MVIVATWLSTKNTNNIVDDMMMKYLAVTDKSYLTSVLIFLL